MSHVPPLPRGFSPSVATVEARGEGKVIVVALTLDQDAFNLRTSEGRKGVSVRLNGSQMDHLIRELITVRGGEWLDALAELRA